MAQATGGNRRKTRRDVSSMNATTGTGFSLETMIIANETDVQLKEYFQAVFSFTPISGIGLHCISSKTNINVTKITTNHINIA